MAKMPEGDKPRRGKFGLVRSRLLEKAAGRCARRHNKSVLELTSQIGAATLTQN